MTRCTADYLYNVSATNGTNCSGYEFNLNQSNCTLTNATNATVAESTFQEINSMMSGIYDDLTTYQDLATDVIW